MPFDSTAHRYLKRHAVLGDQQHARDRYGFLHGRAFEASGADQCGEHDCCLDEGEGSTNADPRTGTEWHELIARITGLTRWRETGRIEPIRVLPQFAVAVDDIDRQANQC